MRKSGLPMLVSLVAVAACGDDDTQFTDGFTQASNGAESPPSDSETLGQTGDGDGEAGDGDPSAGDGDGESEDESTSTSTKFDFTVPDVPPMGDICKVNEEQGDAATPPCQEQAPPDSFEPTLEWSWDGDVGYRDSIVTPLVANLTDDNQDGEIDLCDIPDIVVVVNTGSCDLAKIYVLDGASGQVHYSLDGPFVRSSTPAIGDIDGDGLPEIVAVGGSTPCNADSIVVFEHDGTLKWSNDQVTPYGEHSIALADVDNDGDVEIMANNYMLDHEGQLVFTAPDTAGSSFRYTTTTAADLDDDGDLEIILGRSAWHHDGTEYFFQEGLNPGQPAVGDIDDDGLPEIVLVQREGFSILEHDGTPTVIEINPTQDSDYRRPATIHDLDGDDRPEFALSSNDHYTAYDFELNQLWSNTVTDDSGLASGTAFDFLGDGVAEAIYADEFSLWIFDGQSGATELQQPRRSITIVEYPVVADVDNDGSAEIIVVSNHGAEPTVQVFGEANDSWIQARRIWNQHTYHVTNVREDGTIPQHEAHHWEGLNTFRTNAQIEGGTVCDPVG